MALWRRGPGEIFISYRRADSQTITERIYDRLAQEFGKEAVFKDLSSIPAGTDFPTFIRDRLRRARAVLVVIGPQWATMKNDAGELRLFQPDDAVRMEVAAALGKGAGFLMIPLLVSGASMPRAENLPPDLAALSTRNALLVRNDPDFDGDIRRLVETLAAETGAKPETVKPPKRSGVARRWLLPMGLGALAIILMLCLLTWYIARHNETTNFAPVGPVFVAPGQPVLGESLSVSGVWATQFSDPSVNEVSNYLLELNQNGTAISGTATAINLYDPDCVSIRPIYGQMDASTLTLHLSEGTAGARITCQGVFPRGYLGSPKTFLLRYDVTSGLPVLAGTWQEQLGGAYGNGSFARQQ
jgi:hypothetical protein